MAEKISAIGVLDAAEGLVGEHDPEAEGVVGGVALGDGDLVPGVELLGERREVQAAGTAAKDRDTHGAHPFSPDAMPELLRSSIKRDVSETRCYCAVMTSERINPAELGRPSGFSHAVSVTAAGWCSWPASSAPAGTAPSSPGGIVAQFEQALANVLTALTAAGGAAQATWSASPFTWSTSRTTRRTAARSARSGGGWRAPGTRPWRAWA
jgi:enamine deaminase RidA (YjgF/YER057c/UK114 family)